MDKQVINTLRQPRWIVLIAVGVLLLVAAGLALYHQYAWMAYIKDNTTTYEEIRKTIETQLKSKEVTLATIKQTSIDVDEATQKLCGAQVLFSNLRIDMLESARASEAECEAHKTRLVHTKNVIIQVRKYLETEEKVTAILADLGVSLKKIKETDYKMQKAAWVEASSSLKHVSASKEYKPHITAYQEAIKDITDSYDAIIKANKKKNRTQFDDASVGLRIGYDKPATVAAASAKTYKKLVQELVVQVDKL